MCFGTLNADHNVERIQGILLLGFAGLHIVLTASGVPLLTRQRFTPSLHHLQMSVRSNTLNQERGLCILSLGKYRFCHDVEITYLLSRHWWIPSSLPAQDSHKSNGSSKRKL